MKKFTENINDKVDHFAGSQKVYNEIYNLIDEHLMPKMDGENSDKISIVGKETLVKELAKIVEKEIITSKINLLETYKENPSIVK